MTKVYMFICVLLLQESEVWCPAVSCILGENVADKFKLGGENAISKTCRQDVQVHLPAASHSTGKLLLLLYPSLTVTGKVMALHTRAVSMKREIYYARQINKHRL